MLRQSLAPARVGVDGEGGGLPPLSDMKHALATCSDESLRRGAHVASPRLSAAGRTTQPQARGLG